MKTFRLLLALSTMVFLFGCEEKKTIFGRYSNTFDTLAIHYVDLKGDSSFYHFYQKDSIELVNTGRWSWGQKNKVWFHKWKPFGVIEDESCKDGCIRGVELKNENELVFSYDMPKEMNFYKQEIKD